MLGKMRCNFSGNRIFLFSLFIFSSFLLRLGFSLLQFTAARSLFFHFCWQLDFISNGIRRVIILKEKMSSDMKLMKLEKDGLHFHLQFSLSFSLWWSFLHNFPKDLEIAVFKKRVIHPKERRMKIFQKERNKIHIRRK